jgi:alpha-D-xyloside xylohydrolase
MDFTEPESDPDSQATFDTQTFLGSYRSVCNLYPFMTVCGIYDHQRADEPDGRRRVSIMTRSCYPGLQRARTRPIARPWFRRR